MGLGPPVCLNCLRIMDHKLKRNAIGHRWWRCNLCGIDCNDKRSGHLFDLPTNIPLDLVSERTEKKWWMKHHKSDQLFSIINQIKNIGE